MLLWVPGQAEQLYSYAKSLSCFSTIIPTRFLPTIRNAYTDTLLASASFFCHHAFGARSYVAMKAATRCQDVPAVKDSNLILRLSIAVLYSCLRTNGNLKTNLSSSAPASHDFANSKFAELSELLRTLGCFEPVRCSYIYREIRLRETLEICCKGCHAVELIMMWLC